MNKSGPRLLVVLVIFSILFPGTAAPVYAAAWRTKVDPWVLQTASEGETEFLVYLTAQADLRGARALPTKLEKGNYVLRSLTSIAERTQKGLITQLDRLGVEYHSYWIANMIWVRGGLKTVQMLAGRADVAHVYANPQVKLDAPVKEASSDSTPQAVEWNILKVKAPDVWALGYTGQGVVIGGQDTGYQWDHPALKNQYRGWDGSQAEHDYNWFDGTASPSPTPIDPFGHGTHTMGTMVGDDGGSNQIGMAPGARWIGCRNMDAGGNGTPETYSACYQWFVAPTRVDGSEPRPDLAPDVISNSWSCPPSEGCTDPNVLLTVVQNLVAAGIVSAHSAGNSGSGCSTVSSPAAIYDESFTVGATDSTDTIVGFSSRGPVNVDGSNRPKPDISAPGVGVRSCISNDGYASYSGTSMAGPHVAGLVALLISAKPELRGQVSQIEYTIEQSALHIPWTGCSSSGVPNNAYGWGRIDALAAYQNAHLISINKVASVDWVYPGDTITYTLTITHAVGIGPTTDVVLTDTLPVGTTFVSASSPYTQSGDTIQWEFPTLVAMKTQSVDLAVRVDITTTGTVTNTDYAVRSDQVVMARGEPVTLPIVKRNFLDLNKAASSPMIFPGDLLTYTLTVTNTHGFIPTTNLVLTDTIPLGSTFISASLPYTQAGDVIRWDLSSLEPMSTISVDLVVKADLDAFGAVTNSDYSVRSDQVAVVRGEPVTTQLEKLNILQLDKVAGTSIAFPGGAQVYTLTVKNNHDLLTATNLVLTDTLPVGSSFASTSEPYTIIGDVIRWNIPSLPAQQTINIILVVKIDTSASGILTNADYGVYSDQAAFVTGLPVNTPLGKVFFLPIAIKTP